MSHSRPNVLFVTIDSIRADSVGFAGADRDTTPHMDELASEGTTFENALASGIPTYYSFKSLLGGVNSLSHERTIGLPETATPLAEVFSDAGYVTAGFNAKNPWLTPDYGYDRGFDVYRDFISDDEERLNTGQLTRNLKRIAKRSVAFSDTLTDTLGRLGRMANAVLGLQPLTPAEPLTDAVIEWLETKPQNDPFFLWVHYMDPHYPWVPPAEHLPDSADTNLSRADMGRIWHTVAREYGGDDVTVDEETLAWIHQLYDAEIRRTDSAIGNLLSTLRANGEFEDTLIAVAGDHGTELADHGGFSHGPTTLYQEIINVPLLFRGPGVPCDRRDVAALVDVPRTLCKATIGEVPEEFEGIDLFTDFRDGVTTEVVYDYDPVRNRNADNDVLQARTEPPWKLVRNRDTGSSELYDLATDPRENQPIQEADDRRAQLDAELEKHRETTERRNRTVAEKRRVRERVAELRSSNEI